MLKNLVSIASLVCLLTLSVRSGAQATPTATERGGFQVGGGGTFARPDYGGKNIEGISGFADLDFAAHLGLELNIHYIALNTPNHVAESSYLVGPKAMMTYGRCTPYAKFAVGGGSLVITRSSVNSGKYSGTYFAYDFGGGLDIRVTRHIVVRAIDVEYQKWPSLGNGLSPLVLTAGAAYRFR